MTRMTKAQFIEWLAQFPDEATIEVAIGSAGYGYESYGETRIEPFDPTDGVVKHMAGFDWCGRHFDYDEGTKTITLGSTD